MTAHPIPRVDWRDNTRGLPLAAFDGSSINRISKGKDAEAQSSVERISDRPAPNRFRSEA
jgi:hypothetical protein